MNFLLDIETAADPAPIAQDNFESLDSLIALIAAKPSSTSRTAEALSADPHLTLPVQSGITYLLRYSFIFYEGGLSDSPEVSWLLPAITGNLQWYMLHLADGNTAKVYFTDASTPPLRVPPAKVGYNEISGWLRFLPSAAGNVVLAWRNNLGSSTSICSAGSWMQLIPVVAP